MTRTLAGFRVNFQIYGSSANVIETYSVYVDSWGGPSNKEDARTIAVELAQQRFPGVEFQVASLNPVYHSDSFD